MDDRILGWEEASSLFGIKITKEEINTMENDVTKQATSDDPYITIHYSEYIKALGEQYSKGFNDAYAQAYNQAMNFKREKSIENRQKYEERKNYRGMSQGDYDSRY